MITKVGDCAKANAFSAKIPWSGEAGYSDQTFNAGPSLYGHLELSPCMVSETSPGDHRVRACVSAAAAPQGHPSGWVPVLHDRWRAGHPNAVP